MRMILVSIPWMVHNPHMLTDQSVINLLTRQSVAWSMCAYQLARLVSARFGDAHEVCAYYGGGGWVSRENIDVASSVLEKLNLDV